MAVSRLEDRFGQVTALGTTYTSLGTVPAGTKWNVMLNVTNRLTATANLRAFVADSSWSTGEPTGGTIKAAIAYDFPVGAGDVTQIGGIVMLAGEQLIVQSGTASALDVLANGVAITL